MFLTVAPEGRETSLLEQKGNFPGAILSAPQDSLWKGIWKVGDVSFEDGESNTQ